MKKQKKIILIGLVIFVILLIGIIIFNIIYSLLSKTTSNIAKDFKKLDFNDEYLLIRTLSQKSVSGTWIGWDLPGSGYALNLSSNKITKINSIKGVAGHHIEILGKYDDYIYVYEDSKGTNKIKNGKSYNVLSYAKGKIFKNYMLYTLSEYNSNDGTSLNTTYLMNLDNGKTTKIYEYSSNNYNNEYGSATDAIIIDNNLIAIQVLVGGGNKQVQLYDFNGTMTGYAAFDSRSILTSYNNEYILITDWIDDEYFASCYEVKTQKRTRVTKQEYFQLLYNIDNKVTVNNRPLIDIIGNPGERDDDLYFLILDSSEKIFFKSQDYLRLFSVDKKTGQKIELFNADKYNEKIDDAYII